MTATMSGIHAAIASADQQQYTTLQQACHHLYDSHIGAFFEQFVNAYRATEDQWSDTMLQDGLRDMFHGATIQALQYVMHPPPPQDYDPETVFAWQAPLLAAQYVERVQEVLAG